MKTIEKKDKNMILIDPIASLMVNWSAYLTVG